VSGARPPAFGLTSLDMFQQAVEAFISDHIKTGEHRTQRLGVSSRSLSSEFSVLTQDKFQSPWMLFEAGAVAKRFGLEQHLAPYLIDGLPEAAGRSPLAQL